MANQADAVRSAGLSEQISTSYDRDGVIRELERLRDIARRDAKRLRKDAKILRDSGSALLRFGAEEFANEVQALIDRLKEIPRGYAVGFVAPGSPNTNEIQTAVRQIGSLGFNWPFAHFRG